MLSFDRVRQWLKLDELLEKERQVYNVCREISKNLKYTPGPSCKNYDSKNAQKKQENLCTSILALLLFAIYRISYDL